MENTQLKKYNEVLEAIDGQENHLLLGNGFNRGLGVDTSYKAIFEKMMTNENSVYKDAEHFVIDCNYDLELFIQKMQDDVDLENIFLRKYINNKIKLDFMQATHQIVKSEIKNVYAEHNEGVFLLLNKFTNYFTLNYDSFLYLLLLNYKASDYPENEIAIALQATLSFIEVDMNERLNNIYTEIKSARDSGDLRITLANDEVSGRELKKLTKTSFVTIIKEYSKAKNKGWRGIDINRVVDRILDEEKENNTIENINDGAQLKLFNDSEEYIFDVYSTTQNLFFLHGAFHIYNDGSFEKKITQQSDTALYDRLESILNNEEQEIVCVFQSNNKLDAINESPYLANCLSRLRSLKGNLVVIGSSLAENDRHIFEQINESNIHTLYISATPSSKESIEELANRWFTEKDVVIFDAYSISYDISEDNQVVS